MAIKINTEHGTARQDTFRIHPSDAKPGRNSRMIEAPNYAENVKSLALSIATSGQLQPAEVRRLDDNTLEMVAGYTRRDAVNLLINGFDAIDPDTGEKKFFQDPKATLWVKVVDIDPDTAFIQSIKENVERHDTTDLQEALAQQEIRTTMGWTDSKIARLYGYTNQNRVMHLSKLLSLPEDVQQRVHRGELALSVALLTTDLSIEDRAKIIDEATGENGKVSGPALKSLLRDLYAKDAEAPAPILPAKEPTADTSEEEEEEEEEKPKAKHVKRTAKDLERFAAEAAEDDTKLKAGAGELLDIMVLWFAGKRTDEYLRNSLNEYTKGK